ncbi:NAD(P)/FAD-dependent oxidoreductase [Nitrososphaera sp.]|uniref:NAD(P)/FAD-dependent oxidoreductase n=1 Tax=Nitrososphaera sp. TaxID=1971748 RepID=UPI0017AB26F5|nr:NAD(P)/FAD-dependent oxidoreductase [Nitrososphaera sp.]NWG36059.1 NAD(P)/FAD-dependent oxidoreductase [Nitrososphaera sp.]
MRFAIAGAGVAGSYLGSMLQARGHEVQLFEAAKPEDHWPVCAWGASRHMLARFSKQAGLDFDDYVLHVGKRLRMDLPNDKVEHLDLKGLVTYDKRRWEHDLMKSLEVRYGAKVTKDAFPFGDYDLVLDCTGLHRTLLPKSKEDFIIPAYEYLLENVKGEDEFYTIGYPGAKGYFWYFPLGAGKGFMGAGDVLKKYYGIKEFFERHPEAKVAKKIGRPIRLAPPKRMEPFSDGNIVGVGESIGCVFPMLGEGIIPSLICCDFFLESLGAGKFDFKKYRKRVLSYFAYYDDVYRIVRLKMDGKLSTIRHAKLLMSMYRHMKKEESRFGFEVSLDKMNRLVNAL